MKFQFRAPQSRKNERGHGKTVGFKKKGAIRKIKTLNTFNKALTDLELIDIRKLNFIWF